MPKRGRSELSGDGINVPKAKRLKPDPGAGQQTKTIADIKIGFWNIQDLGGGPSRGPRSQDPIDKIAEVIRSLDCDLFIICEIKKEYKAVAGNPYEKALAYLSNPPRRTRSNKGDQNLTLRIKQYLTTYSGNKKTDHTQRANMNQIKNILLSKKFQNQHWDLDLNSQTSLTESQRSAIADALVKKPVASASSAVKAKDDSQFSWQYQGIGGSQLQRIMQVVNQGPVFYLMTQSPFTNNESYAILYNPQVFEVDPLVEMVDLDLRYSRDPAVFTVEMLNKKAKLQLVAWHAPFTCSEKSAVERRKRRTAALNCFFERLEPYKSADAMTIVAGDFNTTDVKMMEIVENSLSIHAYAQKFEAMLGSDFPAAAAKIKPGGVARNVKTTLNKKGQFHNRYDHMYTFDRNNAQLRHVDQEVINVGGYYKGGKTGVSDHCPIVSTYRFPETLDTSVIRSQSRLTHGRFQESPF